MNSAVPPTSEAERSHGFWPWIDRLGAVDTRGDLSQQLRLRVLVASSLLIIVTAGPNAFYAWLSGNEFGWALVFSFAAFFVFCLIIPVLRWSGSIEIGAWLLVFGGTIPIVMLVASRGGLESPAAVFLLFAPPLAGFLLGPRGLVAMLGFNGASLVGLALLQSQGILSTALPYSEQTETVLDLMNLVTALVVLSGISACVMLAHDFARARMHEAMVAAETAKRVRSEFLATVSHEIRTPLNAIIGMSGILSHTELDEKQTQHLTLIQESGEALLGLLNDVLDVSKLESEALELEEIAFNPHILAVAAARISTSSLHGKETELRVDVPDDGQDYLTDPVRLRQVLINLIGNAVKFTDRGEISVRMRVEPVGEDTFLRFEVQDSGIGIDRDKLNTLFDAFTQADSSTSRKYGGTGLGLSICKRLVTLMGGEIGVNSTLGKGSTFWFTVKAKPLLSVSERKATDRPHEEGAELNDLGHEIVRRKLTILAVDDHGPNLVLLRYLLSPLAKHIDLVESGEKAVQAAKETDYDLILSDMQMPGIDGYETRRLIQRLGEKYEQIPFVAITGRIEREELRRISEAGFVGHVPKPIEYEVLQEAILASTGS